MGVSQSSASSACNYSPVPTEEGKRPRPYNLARDSKYIQLNSSYCTLYDGIVSLVQSNKYADLLIICGGDRYPVHRAIVCPRSTFFEEHCEPREGKWDYASPAKPTKIWIDPSDCESHVLAAVLTFLYTLDYSADGQQALKFGLPKEVVDGDEEGQASIGAGGANDDEESAVDTGVEVESLPTFTQGDPTPSRSASRHSSHATKTPSDPGERKNELVFHVQVCAAGHRFGIAALCDVVTEKINKRLNTGPWNDEMIDCIREVYRYGNNGKLAKLREAVVKTARTRFRVLKACNGWDDLIVDSPEFAAEMLRRL
ncbi:hypothetical protein K458DRAFT_182134 [Lentithecium fluviatile CBS 122367]|uniref:BTB domain-containing protein n=1 Tax=Lentithecium fluviatile CBS 122367 TaxID=1168545 RepID=A0A6G1IEV3_9PLEO|nr:hypothetical protein K458DRAFT_182134 [Lentithecium fluviatile CBS 122367]